MTRISPWAILLSIQLDGDLKISLEIPSFPCSGSLPTREPSASQAIVFRNHQILLTLFSNIYRFLPVLERNDPQTQQAKITTAGELIFPSWCLRLHREDLKDGVWNHPWHLYSQVWPSMVYDWLGPQLGGQPAFTCGPSICCPLWAEVGLQHRVAAGLQTQVF